MSEHKISGAELRDMIIMGAAVLEYNRETVNQLNVFPVPDGDTGTNMSMTMQSAVKEIKSVQAETVTAIADALSLGALKGARGNSGVILSQLFRGFSQALKGVEEIDAPLLTEALKRGTAAAYKAVLKPQEGTMLTVARKISEAAEEAAQQGANVYGVMDCILESGEAALAMTPEQLPVLKEAGVVDSGAKGMLYIYRGFKMALDGEELTESALMIQEEPDAPKQEESAQVTSLEDIKFGYCTEFFIKHLNASFQDADLDEFREKLMQIGDSVVVVKDADIIKVHVHSNAPGKILQYALRLGELDHVKIDNMWEQNRSLQEETKRNEKEFALVAVSVGAGLDSVFEDLSVSALIKGGQTMNPSIDTILKTIQKANARHVIILPNNSNIILAAQQAANLADTDVVVVPTKNIPQGVAAAMAFNPDSSLEENVARMTEAISAVLSGEVTYAVRSTTLNGTHINEHDIIGLIDHDLAAVGETVETASCELLEKMLERKGEEEPIVTVFYGEDVDQLSAEEFVQRMQDKYPAAEFIVQSGGQPLYYYYFSVE